MRWVHILKRQEFTGKEDKALAGPAHDRRKGAVIRGISPKEPRKGTTP